MSSSVTDVSTPPRVRLYVLMYNTKQMPRVKQIFSQYPWAHPIMIANQSVLFENAFWNQLLSLESQWSGLDMVGTLSWKANKKINLEQVSEIVSDRSKWGDSNYVHFSNTVKPVESNLHPHLKTILYDVCNTLKLTHPTEAHYNFWMCSPAKMKAFLEWFHSRAAPAVLAHPLSMTNSMYNGKLTCSELKRLCNVPYYPHVPFVLERLNNCFFDTLQLSELVKFERYPTLFNTYISSTSNPYNPLINETVFTTSVERNTSICHIHIHDLSKICLYLSYLSAIKYFYSIILTFCIGSHTSYPLDAEITYLKVGDTGSTIGPILCALHFIKTENIQYEYLQCLYIPQSETESRSRSFDPLVKNVDRILLIKQILEKNDNLAGIFPNCILKQEGSDEHTIQCCNELSSLLKIFHKNEKYPSGNGFILRKSVVDRVFDGRVELFYNILNDTLTSKLDKIFERIWINVIQDLTCDFLIVNDSMVSQSHIKFNTFDIERVEDATVEKNYPKSLDELTSTNIVEKTDESRPVISESSASDTKFLYGLGDTFKKYNIGCL